MLPGALAVLLLAFGVQERRPAPGTARGNPIRRERLRELSAWSEGQVWCSPEMHGAITGVFKNQIDWIPLAIGAVRPDLLQGLQQASLALHRHVADLGAWEV